MENKSTSLLKLAEEKALLRKELEERKENLKPYIPKECIFNILVRLPLDSLQRSRFVCKPWYGIINHSLFIDAQLLRSDIVLIFLASTVKETLFPLSTSSPLEKPNTLSVESKLFQLQSVHVFHQPLVDPRSKFSLNFLEIKDGKGKIGDFNATCLGRIRATCNGLILLDNKTKKGGLVVMNPVTREMSALPLGTLFPRHDESYGLAFCNSTKTYKLVHLFRDEMQFVSCEILDLGATSWRSANGPHFGLFGWFGYDPVSAIGALHWIPSIDHSEYIVSMAMDEENFYETALPKGCRYYDRIVEVNGLLCFATHEGEMNQIDLWILRNLCGDNWTKHYTIQAGCSKEMVPLYCSRVNGEMVFKDKDGSLYAFDFQCETMRKVEVGKGFSFPAHSCCMPHINSLVSWRIKETNINSDL